MPKNSVSTEWIEALGDEIAQMLTAGDHVDRLRALASLLRRRDIITDAYYRDMRDSLDFIAAALLIGKRNTARLRNGATPLLCERHRYA